VSGAIGHTGSMRISVEPSRQASDYTVHHRIRVRFAETDAMGIVHHSRYLLYLEEARVAYLRHIGRPYPAWRAQGMDATVLEVHVRYLRPLRFDDEFDVHVALAEVSRTTFQMTYLLQRDGDACATGVTAHGLINSGGRPMRLPPWLVQQGWNTAHRGGR
jgi:acyl-CoA thioester hydrolase